MLDGKYVDWYAKSSGLRDKLVAERDVVLTYALRVLFDTSLLDHLAFKGGTCLRKMVFGPAGRFSEDLDFTFASKRKPGDIHEELLDVFNREHYGIRFRPCDFYGPEGGASFGVRIRYRHAWNDSGGFHLQISMRERPTLPLRTGKMMDPACFKFMEFPPFDVLWMEPLEMLSEKVRAAVQRVKVRDLYDLWRFTSDVWDGEVLRRLVVLKLWQVREPFEPDAFFKRIRGKEYDWDDLRRLLRKSDRPSPKKILKAVESRYVVLRDLSPLERRLVLEAKSGRNEALADRLRARIRRDFSMGRASDGG